MSAGEIGSGHLGGVQRWLAPLRRRLVLAAVAVLVAGAAVVAATDPFATTGTASGVTDNGYPTSIATVQEESLTSQTQEDATLGYAGSYDISIPSGTAASQIAQAQATVQSDEQTVQDDETALASAKSMAGPENASTLEAARAEVSTDETALSQAKAQLAADERLSCPAASSSTVTTALSGGGNTGAGTGTGSGGGTSTGDMSAGGGTSSGSGSGSGSGSSSPTGDTGTDVTNAADGSLGASSTQASKPSAVTGSASSTTDTSTSLSGTVDPDGSDTSYDFEWGRTSALGHQTPVEQAGDGNSAQSVSATLTGLTPGTTYDYALVATNAAGTSVGTTQTFQTSGSSCVAERAVITADKQAVDEAKDSLAEDVAGGDSTVTQDEEQLTAAEEAESASQEALATAQSQAANSATTFTGLPSAGKVISRGESVYSLDAHPVPLFYGGVPPYRALYLGVSNGPDVTELQQNLIASLGFGSDLSASPSFTYATEQAVDAWQASLGLPETGVVSLGDFVVAPGPIQVDTVSAEPGTAVTPEEAVLTATSRSPLVTIDLDASQQSEVKLGDPVTITLPNNAATPGVVSSVGKIATAPSSGAGTTGGSSSPTITVEVTPTDLKATGGLDEAPVEVSITNASVSNALAVPVDALVALAGGGYAVEVVPKSGPHYLVAVHTGLFDDAAGLVQVTGSGLHVGQHVVVPNA